MTVRYATSEVSTRLPSTSRRGRGGVHLHTPPRQASISVVVIDGQDVVHAALEAWLTSGGTPLIKIVGNYSHPTDFIAEHPLAEEGVDVVLMALQYEGHGPNFGAVRHLTEVGYRVIVYSYLTSNEIILTSLDAGALTYVAKFESGKHLREAIYAAHAGVPYIPPRTARALQNDRTVGRPRLTERERQVLVAWFRTENKDVVARKLNIEATTVRTHLQRVRAKYAAIGRPASTKAALIARAIQDGILSVDDL
ncbi:response regulator transcription factor [Mycolicibacterium elephantis]|nr:response regulator transcription factor [Mycolicibacterium elephantis]